MPKDGTVHELTSNVGAARSRLGWGCRSRQDWTVRRSAPPADGTFPHRPNPKQETGGCQPPFSPGRPRTWPGMVTGAHSGS